MSEQAEKPSYKKSLNLPNTTFAMKANLVQNEPASVKRWDKQSLYTAIREVRAGAPPYIFHDGPPYANGEIHLGHLLNKSLKDFVVRTRTMMGMDCPYTPGWDCHGLPIEHKVMQDLGEAAATMEPIQIRRKCKKYAEKFVKLQKGQMQRLLTLADYDDPYVTMAPKYEASVLEVFASLVERDVVFRALKPVHWSIDNQTALADAELEYEDREDTSVFVSFEIENPQDLPESLSIRTGEPVGLMIWTTTPWTLPANLAVAVAARAEYTLFRVQLEEFSGLVLIATELQKKVLEDLGAAYDALGSCTGAALEEAGIRYSHPFIERTSPLVTADYVTLEDGTGLVHTAPGHGVEDYQTGLRVGLDIYCPVLADGTFDETVPEWLVGKRVWEANDLVVEQLRESGHLYHDQKFVHSYPHDWRGKQPVIFRATEQWFVGVDRPVESDQGDQTLRQRALEATESKIKFVPDWGQNRMRGMLDSRPDWCISRQRSWGLPIPAFYSADDEPLLTPASVRAVAGVFAQKGSDAWFLADASELLADYDVGADPDAPAWAKSDDQFCTSLRKGGDTFDVWFESGASWASVVNGGWAEKQTKREDGCSFPTDLYLEGSDQHRGWFQHSLLLAIGAKGSTPFKTVLTHGFMVAKDGRKMSKSLGNALNVEDLMKTQGADVCRWWVSSINTDNDIKVDPEFFKLAGEEYRKVRNTIRFLLSNLNDFTFETDKVRFEDEGATSIDAWATAELIKLSDTVVEAYEAFQFRRAHEAIFNFCNETMSAVYLTAVKDRLYCDPADGPRRRQTQTTLHRIVDVLIRLLAPLCPHTADEAWRVLRGDDSECVHLKAFHNVDCMRQIPVSDRWDSVMASRDGWMRQLEQVRQEAGVENPMDLALTGSGDLNGFDATDLADLCGVSRFAVGDATSVANVSEDLKCDRCWKREGTVVERSDGGALCNRCASAVGV